MGGLALGLVLSVLPVRPAAAAPGDVDPSFGGGDGRVPVSAGFDVDSMVANEIEIAPDGGTFVLHRAPVGAEELVRPSSASVPTAPSTGVEQRQPGLPIGGLLRHHDRRRRLQPAHRRHRLAHQALRRARARWTRPSPGTGPSTYGAANALEMRDIEALPGGAVAVLGNPEAAGRPRIVRLDRGGRASTTRSLAMAGSRSRHRIRPLNQFTQGLDLDVDAAGNLYTLAVDVDRQLSVAKVSATRRPCGGLRGGTACRCHARASSQRRCRAGSRRWSARPTAIVPISGAFEVAWLDRCWRSRRGLRAWRARDDHAAPNAVGQPIAVAGDTAYVSTSASKGRSWRRPVVAIDLPGATLRTTFGPGGADGDGVRVISTNPVDEACSGPIDVTSSGHPRSFIRPFELFGGPSTRPTAAGAADPDRRRRSRLLGRRPLPCRPPTPPHRATDGDRGRPGRRAGGRW